MRPESEPAPPSKNAWAKVSHTLRRHGATVDETTFLKNSRVELNSMTSRQFINFLENKFEEHGVTKVVPEAEVMRRHARRVIENRLVARDLGIIKERIAKEAAETELPDDLRQKVADLLKRQPVLSWDDAVAILVGASK